MECHASTPGVPTPTVSNEHKYACEHTSEMKTIAKEKEESEGIMNLVSYPSHWEGPPRSRPRLWSRRWWSHRGPAVLNPSREDTAGCRACSLQLPLRAQEDKELSCFHSMNQLFLVGAVRKINSKVKMHIFCSLPSLYMLLRHCLDSYCVIRPNKLFKT